MIETARLLIRPFTGAERAQVLAHWLDPANERAPGQPEDLIRYWAGNVPWGVWEQESGELVGDCSLSFDRDYLEWELSYGFVRSRWRRGYATEAARACVAYGFEAMALEKIVADVHDNPASRRVLEKCGFAEVRPEYFELTPRSARAA